MFEKLARLLASWHTKVKNWHAIWHVRASSSNISTLIGTLARKNGKLASFWHIGTQGRLHVNHTGTQARWQSDYFVTHGRLFSKLVLFILLLFRYIFSVFTTSIVLAIRKTSFFWITPLSCCLVALINYYPPENFMFLYMHRHNIHYTYI